MLNSLRGGLGSGVTLWYDSDGYIFDEDRPERTWPTHIPYTSEPAITFAQAQALIDLVREGEEANR